MKIFVSGTDTGVGKTYVLKEIIKYLKLKGCIIKAVKPIETGCLVKDGNLYPQDAGELANITGQELDEVCPYRFINPLSPYVAAKLEGKEINCNSIKEHIDNIYLKLTKDWGHKKEKFLFIEGAGGLMVPVTRDFMMIDFPKLIGASVILVTRLSLGTINHTLLSLEALEKRNIPVKGIVINDSTGYDGIAEKTNEGTLREFVNVPILSIVKKGGNITNLSLSI